MKKMKKVYIFFLTVGILFSCTENFEEINTDPTSPTVVPAEFLIARVIKDSFRTQGNWWTTTVLQWGNWIQHYGNANAGFTTAHYLYIQGYSESFWNFHYELLLDLQKAKELAEVQNEGDALRVKMAIIEIVEITVWQRLTDMMGDIPYNDALQGSGNATPVYDTQQAVYTDLIARIDAAVSQLNPSDFPFLGSADFFYAGDVEKWIKFGNYIKLRLGLRISEIDPGLAQSTVSAAMSSTLPESNDDNAQLALFGGAENANKHPMVELYSRGEADAPFVGEAFINTLKDLNDPRLPIMVEATVDSQNAGNPDYVGIPPAPSSDQYAQINANQNAFSRPNRTYYTSENYNKPLNALTFAEVSFAKAEAALRGWGASAGDAQTFFQEGIRASMTIAPFTDAGLSNADINAYIAANGTLSGSTEQQWEQIMTQKWINFYVDQSDEAFSEWRRSGFPELTPGLNQGETNGTIPRRLRYVNDEILLNTDNYNTAVGRLNDGDTYTSSVWWDVN